MFKHIILEYSSDDETDDDESEVENIESKDEEAKRIDVDKELDNSETETIELNVFVKCRDQWMSKDQV